jgi:hypothetical protein
MIPGTVQLRDALAAKLADLKVFASGNLTREQIAQELARIVLPQQDAGDPELARAAPMLERLRAGQDQDADAGADG